ncbi:MAG: RusA family crossover junction endodeoxyribonuclease, partial [Sulfuricaulis sp.]|nr:RusA family crossover junction endodeoxyribonuclease [Sulfuricaulis sp.]
AWIEEATYSLHEELRRDTRWRKTITVDVRADYQFGKPDNRKQDVANREKAVSDLLVRAGILADDSQIVDLRLRWADADGCLVTIWNAKAGE